ncbi:hypothetical protein SAMCFNEI73_pC1659 (plasmid) [Sinorhizobium americanum]|uniref:Uncharacterized protein n=1 Tax=Sinorhizobium americanum TaxID=194963 RepID=A0A1L3LZB9_9HYPH|nr:hypothetical protein SAMCFNEI73_pC1659 [Sinorhizobium americanum]
MKKSAPSTTPNPFSFVSKAGKRQPGGENDDAEAGVEIVAVDADQIVVARRAW